MEQKKKSNNPGGRPKREFDKVTFEELCHINCTIDEIEKILHTDQRILDRWCQETYSESFNTIYKKLSENGKASVRRNQINLSKTNGAVAIWLGKVLLKQKEPLQEAIESGELSKLLMSNQTLMDQISKAQEVAKCQSALNAAHNASKTEIKSELDTG